MGAVNAKDATSEVTAIVVDNSEISGPIDVRARGGGGPYRPNEVLEEPNGTVPVAPLLNGPLNVLKELAFAVLIGVPDPVLRY